MHWSELIYYNNRLFHFHQNEMTKLSINKKNIFYWVLRFEDLLIEECMMHRNSHNTLHFLNHVFYENQEQPNHLESWYNKNLLFQFFETQELQLVLQDWRTDTDFYFPSFLHVLECHSSFHYAYHLYHVWTLTSTY